MFLHGPCPFIAVSSKIGARAQHLSFKNGAPDKTLLDYRGQARLYPRNPVPRSDIGPPLVLICLFPDGQEHGILLDYDAYYNCRTPPSLFEYLFKHLHGHVRV